MPPQTAAITYASWGLTFNGGFWEKVPRQKVLSMLLNMCHSTLIIGEKINLQVLSKVSQDSISASDIIKLGDNREGTFRYRTTSIKLSDSGYVNWQQWQ